MLDVDQSKTRSHAQRRNPSHSSDMQGILTRDLDIDCYNEIPYDDRPYHLTHIRHLEALAVLHGLEPAPITCCRVLELGAASGGNLIPQAVDLPLAQFVGVDLSEQQVVSGKKTIEQLGLSNIELLQHDIMEMDESLGTFDYIIAHGVYSWVTPEVRDRTLELCSRLLRPHGVAVISYNTFPGWHLRNITRDLIGLHCTQFDEPSERLEQGLGILDFMSRTVSKNRAYGRYLEEENDLQNEAKAPGYFFHEFLETSNYPCYFLQFIEHTESKRLQYLCEAHFRTVQLGNYPAPVVDLLQDTPLHRKEQYLDFIQNRSFRTSLLCHSEIDVNRSLSHQRIMRMHIGMVDEVQVSGSTEQTPGQAHRPARFTMSPYGSITISHPLAAAAMRHLVDIYPSTIDFRQLCKTVFSRAGVQPENCGPADIDMIAASLLAGFRFGMIEMSVHAPNDTQTVSQHPEASPLARQQAASGDWITNLRHQAISLDEIALFLIPLLDGRHDRAELIARVQEAISQRKIHVGIGHRHIDPNNAVLIGQIYDHVMGEIAKLSLLVR